MEMSSLRSFLVSVILISAANVGVVYYISNTSRFAVFQIVYKLPAINIPFSFKLSGDNASNSEKRLEQNLQPKNKLKWVKINM
jgi:hypothetical protein